SLELPAPPGRRCSRWRSARFGSAGEPAPARSPQQSPDPLRTIFQKKSRLLEGYGETNEVTASNPLIKRSGPPDTRSDTGAGFSSDRPPPPPQEDTTPPTPNLPNRARNRHPHTTNRVGRSVDDGSSRRY